MTRGVAPGADATPVSKARHLGGDPVMEPPPNGYQRFFHTSTVPASPLTRT